MTVDIITLLKPEAAAIVEAAREFDNGIQSMNRAMAALEHLSALRDHKKPAQWAKKSALTSNKKHELAAGKSPDLTASGEPRQRAANKSDEELQDLVEQHVRARPGEYSSNNIRKTITARGERVSAACAHLVASGRIKEKRVQVERTNGQLFSTVRLFPS